MKKKKFKCIIDLNLYEGRTRFTAGNIYRGESEFGSFQWSLLSDDCTYATLSLDQVSEHFRTLTIHDDSLPPLPSGNKLKPFNPFIPQRISDFGSRHGFEKQADDFIKDVNREGLVIKKEHHMGTLKFIEKISDIKHKVTIFDEYDECEKQKPLKSFLVNLDYSRNCVDITHQTEFWVEARDQTHAEQLSLEKFPTGKNIKIKED